MGHPDRRAGIWFDKQTEWQAPLRALRDVALASPLEETFKWRGPVYTAHGGNVAVIWSMKAHCGLGFFKGVLLDDSRGRLVAPGPNSRSVRMATFTESAQIHRQEAELTDFIAQAIANEAAGRKVDFPKDDLDLPEELLTRLEADPELQTAWNRLTPGRRRGYVLHISGAKQARTREARIDKWTPLILDGKGMQGR